MQQPVINNGLDEKSTQLSFKNNNTNATLEITENAIFNKVLNDRMILFIQVHSVDYSYTSIYCVMVIISASFSVLSQQTIRDYLTMIL